MQNRLVFFDADDTLWENERFFRKAEDSFVQLMSGYATENEIRKTLAEEQENNIPIFGYGSKTYLIGMTDCAVRLCGEKFCGSIYKGINGIIRSLAAHRLDIIDGVEETLETLGRDYRLVIATKGDLKEQTERAGRILAESVDLDQILSIAQAAPELEAGETRSVHPADGYGLAENRLTGGGCSVRDGKDRKEGQKQLRIGIARDEAFCFYYKVNLELLKEVGCELVPFSPLRDKKLPENISGLILGGGYPELYGKRLSENRGLLDEIRRSLDAGMPCLAECGGFMYLHEQMEDRDGNVYPLAGVIKGKTCPAGKLVRFGYVNITADKEADWLLPGETIRGHEFHYWDSTDSGNDCMAVKPDGKRKWNCIHMRENMFAGYPHLYLPSMPEFARRFAVRCYEWERTRCGNCHSTGECSKK